MTFAEAMAAVARGETVRRAGWGPRRGIRIMREPWNGEQERLLLFDLFGSEDVTPFPYSLTGEDARTDDWETGVMRK